MLGPFGNIIKILWISFWAGNMYSVLAYGLVGDFPHMGSNMVESIGYAYLIQKLDQIVA